MWTRIGLLNLSTLYKMEIKNTDGTKGNLSLHRLFFCQVKSKLSGLCRPLYQGKSSYFCLLFSSFKVTIETTKGGPIMSKDWASKELQALQAK